MPLALTWYLVPFDGTRIKCANKFPSAQRPSTMVTDFSIYCLKQAEGDFLRSLLRVAPARGTRRKTSTHFDFDNEFSHLDGQDSFCELQEMHNWESMLVSFH
jgi:hypothetical protein